MTRLASNSSHQGHGNQRISAGSATDIQAIIATLPDGSQQNVQKVVSERDAAVQQKEMVKQLLAAGQDKLKDSVSAALWPSAGNKLTSRRQNWLKNDKRPRLLYVN
jgi:hypothetical protein